MSNGTLIRLYDTWGSGSYTCFARLRKYKRKEGYRVEVLHKYFSGAWRMIAAGQVFSIEEAAEFVAEHEQLVTKKQVLKAFEEVGVIT